MKKNVAIIITIIFAIIFVVELNLLANFFYIGIVESSPPEYYPFPTMSCEWLKGCEVNYLNLFGNIVFWIVYFMTFEKLLSHKKYEILFPLLIILIIFPFVYYLYL